MNNKKYEFKEIVECDSLNGILDVIKVIKDNDNSINSFYYRGQRDSDWHLASSLKRGLIEEFKEADDKTKVQITIDEINREREIYNEFRKNFKDDIELMNIVQNEIKKKDLQLKFINISNNFDLNTDIPILALMQHYGEQTRALDFTENVLIALYFSVTDAEKDSALWMLDTRMMYNIFENQYKSEYKELPIDKKINFNNRNKYFEYLEDNLKFYQRQLSRYNDPQRLDTYCIKDKEKYFKLDESIYEINAIGKEVHSVFVEDLHSNTFNERLHRQYGVFILQSYKPMDIKEEYDEMIEKIKNGHYKAKGLVFDDNKIHSPFTKIIIKKECHQEIRDYLDLVGITKESLGL